MTVFELLTETAKADRDLLIKNDEAGDDFNKPREVDFNCVSGFMLRLSRLFQIEYQGWGSVIQKAQTMSLGF
jgi:hypothetical protein